MDPSEFPTLEEANAVNDSKHSENDPSPGLEASWAQVVKEDGINSEENGQPGAKQEQNNSVPVESVIKEDVSFADITKQDLPENQEFPTLEQSTSIQPPESVEPESAGVGDLLSKSNESSVQDSTIPPHPDRSFATVASNREFPSLDATTKAEVPVSNDLSDLPDVKDMLKERSVKVPPPPPSQSFAKIASKEPPPTEKPLSDRAKQLMAEQEKLPESPKTELNHNNFPTLAQSKLMAEHHASPTGKDKELFTEISRLHEAAEAVEPEEEPTSSEKDTSDISSDMGNSFVKIDPSFAKITGSNLENAPPSAYPKHVPRHPSYDEDTIMRERTRAEARKMRQEPHGEETTEEFTPEMKVMEQKKKEIIKEKIEEEKEAKVEKKQSGNKAPTSKSRGVEQDSTIASTAAAAASTAAAAASTAASTAATLLSEAASSKDDIDSEAKEDVDDEIKAVETRIKFFDKRGRGKITMLDTFCSLRGLGYSFIFAIPATVLMHLRLSPLTSPHGFPFFYRSLTDLLTLPIYTKRVAQALTYNTPMLAQDEGQVNNMIQAYGHKAQGSSLLGLSFWDGFRAMRANEKKTLRWWQFKQWGIHRLQWVLAYTMLHDPETKLVTQPTLNSLHRQLIK
ncbi:hypothetical protein PHYBLDRAFT_76969 [Phycomyces blakesleeanus NRRL 1555(-)]|uniref:Uncharacterized protein n=1 Tax=Phycomyces blakesleeanus (strain ATCC 8743b / DSM 1359 / FGSC 10004 / NBRC 33097 / NRRL 1555) TaxID=763407 RepID=A0A162UZA0_PHYB8|nr:hypothetical protein PHYBLDRAFT_76969 [Phycomyces blakesleeanus NRRL 1555(-)]OAD78952.1 hypothetical protein PHYBLDRAFT_76969 [Phycomyces blakesleeanus NRRL 1555(-)]|eukprot:XP_018296992.1 hypothetical protein PHYBLDRAFT_76969 [Phycomyces blakesleeanus NRRL 1555(-)]